jgi:hypothetical protein
MRRGMRDAYVIPRLSVAVVLLRVWDIVRLVAAQLGAPARIVPLVRSIWLLLFVLGVIRSPILAINAIT